MLVLGRRQGEQITIGDEIVISIIRARNGSVRIGVEAPKSFAVRRRQSVDCREKRTETPEIFASAKGEDIGATQ